MKTLIYLVMLMLSSTILPAQDNTTKKLGNVQLAGLRAPSKVKIDGKLNEWTDGFQAYNKATRVLYAMANDDKNIYLIVRSSDFTTAAKIIAGGVALVINTNGKKNDKNPFSVTFPVIDNPRRLSGGFGNRIEGRGAGADTEMMRAIHERTINAAKQIRVVGFKDITDTLISIYNENNIKTAINFDAAGDLTFELSIPITSLDLSIDKPKEIVYNIVLNGLPLPPGAGPAGGGGGGGGGSGGRNALDFMDLVSPSDFWGKYTLAKQ